MKETGSISKSQTYGAMKKGICLICGKDISNYSWEKQERHARECKDRRSEELKQTTLFD